jgi:hypothetical protein
VIFALLTATMLVIAHQTAPPRASTATAAIRGSVVAADSRMPIRGVRVALSRVPTVDAGGVPVLGVNWIREAITGRSGAFEFGRLEAGRYEIQPMPLDESAPFIAPFAGRVVELAAGQVVDSVEVPLTRGGVIAGRVTDADGTPLTRINVFAFAVASSSPGRVRQYSAASSTNDLGQFRIFGLPEGQFLVSAEAGMSNYAAPGSAIPAETLVPTFYPSTILEEDAGAVRVRSGAETPPVEIRMLQGRRSRVTGAVLDSAGSPVARVVGFVTRPSNRMRGGAGSPFTTDQFGRFDVRDLAPGNYLLSASKLPDTHALAPARPMELANVALTIAGSDIENLIVRTSPGATLRGQLEFDRPPAEAASLRVSVTIGNPDGTCVERSSVTTFADDNHAFEVGDLFCPYLVRASVPGFVLKNVVLDGTDITDTPHRFANGDRVTVILTSHTSTVDGTVVDDGDRTVPDCEVVAFSDDPARWIGSATALNRAACDGKGHFRLTQVLPGRYLVVATPRGRLPAVGLSGTLFEELSRQATSFAVGEDESRTVQLRVVDSR